jgi:glycosyltransferase involved in cell wall biosynthesis
MTRTDTPSAAAEPQSDVLPSVLLLFTTFNRLEYTRLSLPRLLEDSTERFELIIWDNGSTDGTADFLRGIRDSRIRELVLRPTNEGQAVALNTVWSQTDAVLCGKVDNDCLMTPGWTRVLAAAHRDVPELGGVGCWHFMPEDFDKVLAAHKIRRFGSHRLVVHPHIGGSGLLTKSADFRRFGPIDPRYLQSTYWWRLAADGRVNGWYYPLIYQEHMDDPRSEHCVLPQRFSEEDVPFALRSRGWKTRQEFEGWLRRDARSILSSPSELKYYVGWRRIWREWPVRLANGLRRLSREVRARFHVGATP